MKKFKAALCVALVALGMAGAAWAEEKVSVEVTADFFSKYVWRGQNLTDDWVFQPGVSATYRGLTVGVWGSLDLTNENDQRGEFIEYDWYIDYSGQINDTVGYSIGAIYYYFPSVGNTTELYWGFNLDVPASPSITVYHDVDEADGIYVSFGVGHSIEATEKIPVGIDLSAAIGWGNKKYNEYYWGTDKAELNDLTISVGFPFEVAGVSVTPSVSYIALLGSDVRDSDAYGRDNNIVVVGVSLAKEF